jgi:methionyl-tRNA formyltransferase
MNVLLLSPYPESLFAPIEQTGDNITIIARELVPGYDYGADLVVSYGYRFIVKEPFLTLWKGHIYNIHTGYLPYNRGASPNLWSWYDDTPKGVTIHAMDEGIDTGSIIARRIADMKEDETLKTSYEKLQIMAGKMFFDWWPFMRAPSPVLSHTVGETGSYHTKAESTKLLSLFPKKYDTPVRVISEMGRQRREDHGARRRGSGT